MIKIPRGYRRLRVGERFPRKFYSRKISNLLVPESNNYEIIDNELFYSCSNIFSSIRISVGEHEEFIDIVKK